MAGVLELIRGPQPQRWLFACPKKAPWVDPKILELQAAKEILAEALGSDTVAEIASDRLSNRTAAAMSVVQEAVSVRPVGIYQLDGIVRRAPSLQATTDGRQGAAA